jgi:phosphoribosylaminoimidazole-succinocarboxamide synthase
MAAVIPHKVVDTSFGFILRQAGLTHIHRGKVRNTYFVPDPALLLVLASDRVSIFDFVLPALVPYKGEILTALTVFWLTEVLSQTDHHLVAFGTGIDQYLPPELRGNAELHKRGLIVRRLKMVPVECIVRGYLTGSGLKSYKKTGHVCGIELAPGLHDGSRILPHPIFTPTTKAESGHDEHLPTAAVIERYGAWTRYKSLACYQKLAEVAEAKGIIVADTKLEYGEDGVLADEVGTPDSSRFWDKEEWAHAAEQQKSPPPFDKEVVRNWGKEIATPVSAAGGEVGLQHLDPENDDHLTFVANLTVPQSVLDETSQRYQIVLQRLTGLTLDEFQKQKLGVTA